MWEPKRWLSAVPGTAPKTACLTHQSLLYAQRHQLSLGPTHFIDLMVSGINYEGSGRSQSAFEQLRLKKFWAHL
jgi:hypothetical protein